MRAYAYETAFLTLRPKSFSPITGVYSAMMPGSASMTIWATSSLLGWFAALWGCTFTFTTGCGAPTVVWAAPPAKAALPPARSI